MVNYFPSTVLLALTFLFPVNSFMVTAWLFFVRDWYFRNVIPKSPAVNNESKNIKKFRSNFFVFASQIYRKQSLITVEII